MRGPALRVQIGILTFLAIILLAPTICAAAGAEGPALTLDGTWVLVEQRYGTGENNLAADDSPIRLRIESSEARPSVWIWRGESLTSGTTWPALISDDREMRALSKSVHVDAGKGAIAARYEIVPVEGEDLVLEIQERYELSADGSALEGRVEVRFTGGERNRGGYTLHRRFVKEK